MMAMVAFTGVAMLGAILVIPIMGPHTLTRTVEASSK